MGLLGLCVGLAALHAGANEAFLARCRELADRAADHGSPVIAGRDGWLFLASELRHLGAGPFWGETAVQAGRAADPQARDPLPAILDFHRQLQAKGVELILVPVPPKAVVHAAQLPGDGAEPDSRPDLHHLAFYEALRREGLNVLDLTEAFRDWDDQPHGPPYCRQDTHWSGAACVEAARQIAERAHAFLEGVPRESVESEWTTLEIDGDLRRMLGDETPAREAVAIRRVKGARIGTEGPVILLGDSHALVFHAGEDMHGRDAGLADQLAAELGVPVVLIGVRGSGATSARISLFRRAQRDPTYWEGKRVLVWVFAAREFTEADGWYPVPLD